MLIGMGTAAVVTEDTRVRSETHWQRRTNQLEKKDGTVTIEGISLVAAKIGILSHFERTLLELWLN